MLTRIISAVIGAAAFLALLFSGFALWTAGVTLLAAVAIGEFNRAYAGVKVSVVNTAGEATEVTAPRVPNQALNWVGALFPFFLYNAVQTGQGDLLRFAFIQGGLTLAFALRLRRASQEPAVLGRLKSCFGLIGLAYIGMLFSSFVMMRGIGGKLQAAPFPVADRGAWLMLFTAACVWATDSFAYFVGRSLGKHKMAPSISPAKTWEGFAGGLAGSMAIGLLFANWIHLPWSHGAAVGLIAGILGPMGDLFESALKRELGVKDFGAVMPGHGGALDRFDSLLFVTPVVYLYLRVIVKI